MQTVGEIAPEDLTELPRISTTLFGPIPAPTWGSSRVRLFRDGPCFWAEVHGRENPYVSPSGTKTVEYEVGDDGCVRFGIPQTTHACRRFETVEIDERGRVMPPHTEACVHRIYVKED